MFFQNGKILSSSNSLFERVGGLSFFERLVDRFYEGVAVDPVLIVLYAEPNDLEKARLHLTWFLAQYWGGPPMFNENRGDPKLRMRHMPFRIGPVERDQWLLHMLTAVDELTPCSSPWLYASLALFPLFLATNTEFTTSQGDKPT